MLERRGTLGVLREGTKTGGGVRDASGGGEKGLALWAGDSGGSTLS